MPVWFPTCHAIDARKSVAEYDPAPDTGSGSTANTNADTDAAVAARRAAFRTTAVDGRYAAPSTTSPEPSAPAPDDGASTDGPVSDGASVPGV